MPRAWHSSGLPVLLKLNGKPLLIHGEGPRAVRAAFQILEGGGKVLWSGSALPKELKSFQSAGQLRLLRGNLNRRHLATVAGIFTLHPHVRENQRLKKLARQVGIWVGSTEPEGSESGIDILLGAVIWRGPLQLGLWMQEGPDGLKRWLLRRLLKQWGPEWEKLLGGLLSLGQGRWDTPLGREWLKKIPKWLKDLRKKRQVKVEHELAACRTRLRKPARRNASP